MLKKNKVFHICLILICILYINIFTYGHELQVENINPNNVFRDSPKISFHLGYEISVMTATDGKYYYGRGCCYGNYYDLQVWGTGNNGTVRGRYYGTINGPSITWDNGNESVLLYIPKTNKLIYWKYNDPVIYWTLAKPEGELKFQWNLVNLQEKGLPMSSNGISLSNDNENLLVYNYVSSKIGTLDTINFNIVNSQGLLIENNENILKSSINEDSHTFAYDGSYYYFGTEHGGNCYSIYDTSGKFVNKKCINNLHGSILIYDWVNHLYGSCGTDMVSPISLEVFNGGAGNGAHCTYWSYNKNIENSANNILSCNNVPHVYGDFIDEDNNTWLISQNGCNLLLKNDIMNNIDCTLELINGFWSCNSKFIISSKQSMLYPLYNTNIIILDHNNIVLGQEFKLKRIVNNIHFINGNHDGLLTTDINSLDSLNLLKNNNGLYIAWNTMNSVINDVNNIDEYETIAQVTTNYPNNMDINYVDNDHNCNNNKKYIPVKVDCIKGDCKLPVQMYWGVNYGLLCNNQAIGLISPLKSQNKTICNVDFDNMNSGYTALYIQRNNNPDIKCHGIYNTEHKYIKPLFMSIYSKNDPNIDFVDTIPITLGKISNNLADIKSKFNYVNNTIIEILNKPLVTGPQGPQGPDGDIGDVGDAGVEGPEGPEGPQGPRGPDGPQGPQGPEGPQGPDGPQGDAGVEGPQGVIGMIGDVGDVGDEGARGETGRPGIKGLTGPQGPKGPKGPTGDAGPQGDDGIQGNVGPQGIDGPEGPRGKQGPMGKQGPKGIPGPVGVPGKNGPAGPQGPIGIVGEQGPQGPQGLPGNKGKQGPEGPKGPQGPQGPLGKQGPQGIKGNVGPQGPKGPVGPQGPPGLDADQLGLQAPQGPKGPQGPQGPQGPKGRKGKTGMKGKIGKRGIRGERGDIGDKPRSHSLRPWNPETDPE